MKIKLVIILGMATATSAFGKADFSPLALDQHIAECPVIAVGHIASADGRRKSDVVGEFTQDTELVVSAILKGIPREPLHIHWERHVSKGLDSLPPGKDAIWLLMRKPEDGSLFANRVDSRYPLSKRQEIGSIISKQAFSTSVSACDANGGMVRQVGKGGISKCIIPFADAGHKCSDSTECIGGCFYSGPKLPAPGTAAMGNCRRDTNPYGCFNEIKDGKVQDGICKD